MAPDVLGSSYGCALTWRPAGQWLAVTGADSSSQPRGLLLVSLLSGEKRQLVRPERQPEIYTAAAFRPDGRYLVFVAVRSFAAGELRSVALSEQAEPLGQPERLTTSTGRLVASPVWTPHGDEVLFLSGPWRGNLSLWRIRPKEPKSVRRMPTTPEGAVLLSSPRRSGAALRMAYAKESEDTNFWSIQVPGAGRHPFRAVQRVRSSNL